MIRRRLDVGAQLTAFDYPRIRAMIASEPTLPRQYARLTITVWTYPITLGIYCVYEGKLTVIVARMDKHNRVWKESIHGPRLDIHAVFTRRSREYILWGGCPCELCVRGPSQLPGKPRKHYFCLLRTGAREPSWQALARPGGRGSVRVRRGPARTFEVGAGHYNKAQMEAQSAQLSDILGRPEIVLCILEQLDVQTAIAASRICHRTNAVVASNAYWLLAHCDHHYRLYDTDCTTKDVYGSPSTTLQRLAQHATQLHGTVSINSAQVIAQFARPLHSATVDVARPPSEIGITKCDPYAHAALAVICPLQRVADKWTMAASIDSSYIRIRTARMYLIRCPDGQIGCLDSGTHRIYATPNIITNQLSAAIAVEASAIVDVLWSDSFDLRAEVPMLITAAQEAEERLLGPAD